MNDELIKQHEEKSVASKQASGPTARKLLAPYNSLGEALEANREKKGLSQNKAHSELGVSRVTYIHWEKNHWTPSTEYIPVIADFLEDVDASAVATYLLRMNGAIPADHYVEIKSS